MKAVIVLIPERFRDEEFSIPKKILIDSGIDVTVAGLEMKEAKGMLGMKVMPDVPIADIEISEYDILVLPGGGAAIDYMGNNPAILEMVKDARDQGKIVAAICLSGAVLANAGILTGRKATVFATPQSLQIFKEKGVEYTGEGVTVEGRVVTASGPEYAEEFAREIIKLAKG